MGDTIRTGGVETDDLSSNPVYIPELKLIVLIVAVKHMHTNIFL